MSRPGRGGGLFRGQKVDYAAVGEEPGSKYDRARELGLNIMGEEEFMKVIAA